MNKCRLIMWGAPGLVGLVVVSLYAMERHEARTITLDNYHRITEGMMTEEVEAILGKGEERDPSTKRTYSIAMSNRLFTGKEPLPEKYLVWHRRGGGPNWTISLQLSQSAITPQMAITKMSINKCRVRPWTRGSMTLRKYLLIEPTQDAAIRVSLFRVPGRLAPES